jgi:hypothetical protein
MKMTKSSFATLHNPARQKFCGLAPDRMKTKYRIYNNLVNPYNNAAIVAEGLGRDRRH